jgi:hypothetical protein
VAHVMSIRCGERIDPQKSSEKKMDAVADFSIPSLPSDSTDEGSEIFISPNLLIWLEI